LMASQANHFQSIILDMGSTSAARDGGQRVEDLTLMWAINSHAREVITARDDDFSLDQIKRYLAHERRALKQGESSIFLTPSKVLSRRERKEVIGERSKLLATEVEILTRDLRSIEKMENSHSTLNLSSPSSPIVRDIARYLERGRYS